MFTSSPCAIQGYAINASVGGGHTFLQSSSMVSRSPALDASIRTLALKNKGLYERFSGVEGGVVELEESSGS